MAENPFKKVGGFVANEMLGLDDFGRVFTKAASGDVSGALKSAATGAFELGSTVLSAGTGTVAKQAIKQGAKQAVKQGAKESVEAGVKAGAKGSTYKSAPGPSDLLGAQFKPKAGTITKPKVAPKPAKPGDLPGAPGYPRTPAKPGDLPGAPGYPKPAPEPAPVPKPLPKPLPKPAPAPKPATKPAAPKPTKKAGPSTITPPKAQTSTSRTTAEETAPQAQNKAGRQFKNLPRTALGTGLALGVGETIRRAVTAKGDGPWTPSDIV